MMSLQEAGLRRALSAAEKVIASLQLQVKAHDAALDLLSLCIPSVDPRSATAIPRALPDRYPPATSNVEQIQRSLDSLRAQDGHVPPALLRRWEGLLADARAAADEEAPASEPRPIPWERVANLSAEEIAACDALAERLGLSRESCRGGAAGSRRGGCSSAFGGARAVSRREEPCRRDGHASPGARVHVRERVARRRRRPAA